MPDLWEVIPHALPDALHLQARGLKDKAPLPGSKAAKQAAKAERKDARGKAKKDKIGTKEITSSRGRICVSFTKVALSN
jgi:hypothetical protein